MMKNTFKLVVLVLGLSICPATASGQGQCTMQNMAATYAFTLTGASTIVLGPAPDTFHWSALYAPAAGVGVITIKPDGKLEGQYWVVSGTVNFGLTPIPLHGTATVNADCTGTIVGTLPDGSTQEERFVVLGNGREIHSVATETGVPTGNWLTTAYRLGGSCGQHKVHGDYLFECRNLFELPVPPPDPNIFGGAIHIRTLIAPGGDYTATVYGKVGPSNSEFPASGHLTVHDDCTAEGTLETPFLPTVSHARGVFFDEGRRGYWLPLVNVLPDGSTRPQPYGYCVITKVDNTDPRDQSSSMSKRGLRP